MGFEFPVTAFHIEGTHEHLNTLEELQKTHGCFGAKHRNAYTGYDGNIAFHEVEWIVRDALGATILPEDVPRPARRYAWWALRSERARRAADLGLPIPGTGRKGSYRWRSPFAYQGGNRAATALAADLADELTHLEGRHLASFRHARIVDGYDDRERSCERSWKDQRRTRWK